MEEMNKPQLFLHASLRHYFFLLQNENDSEAMKPQSYEAVLRSDNWCGQQPLVIRQSEVAGSFLRQVPCYAEGMKKDKLPSNTKSNPVFFKVF